MTSAEGVSGTFPCSGRREVRELGVNYYCISFETPRATELGEDFFPPTKVFQACKASVFALKRADLALEYLLGTCAC